MSGSRIRRALEDGFARGDEESLVAFWEALLGGELLVAPGAGEAQHPVVLGDAPAVALGGLRGSEGEPVAAAFTGADELDAWAGWGAARLVLGAGALAGAVLDAGIHELSLNPAGPVGRRLDAVELRHLAAGLPPRLGRAGFAFDPRSGIAVARPLPEPPPSLGDALRTVCAHSSDVAAAYLLDLLQPLRSADITLAVALEVDDPADAGRREELMELIGAVVTQAPGARLDGIGFVWLDGRLAALARARVRPAYLRAGGRPAAPPLRRHRPPG